MAVSGDRQVAEDADIQAKARFEILLAACLYTRWPASAFDQPREGGSAIRIGIVGSDPHLQQLERLAGGRQIAGRQVVIRHYPGAAEAEPCQILFIAGSLPRSDRQALIEKYKSSPVLLASSAPGFSQEGGGLYFYIHNGSVKFALNTKALVNQNLTVDSRFSRLARPPSSPTIKFLPPAATQNGQPRQTLSHPISPLRQPNGDQPRGGGKRL